MVSFVIMIFTMSSCYYAREERLKVEDLQRRIVKSSRTFAELILMTAVTLDTVVVTKDMMHQQVFDLLKQYWNQLDVDEAEQLEFLNKLKSRTSDSK